MWHYYISIQNPTVTSDGAWISLFKPTKNHKVKFFFCKCNHQRRLSDGYSPNRRLSDGYFHNRRISDAYAKCFTSKHNTFYQSIAVFS